MIASLDGRVIAVRNDGVIVNVGGVGYYVRLSAPFLAQARDGDEFFCFTHLAVTRENEGNLYGFKSLEELELFELLITVQGVGPKAALGMLSAMESATIVGAIAGDQAGMLTRVPGIGQKTAQRIVLDLKSKVGGFATTMTPISASDTDALSALTALGYSIAEAQGALKGLEPKLSLEEKIFAALQRLSS